MNAEFATQDQSSHACLASLSALPAELVGELGEAWQALENYELELSRWHEQLESFRCELVSLSGRSRMEHENPNDREPKTTAPATSASLATSQDQVAQRVSAAARQFAALHRQRSARKAP